MRRKWLSALTLLSLLVHAASAQPAAVEVVPSAVLPALDAVPLLAAVGARLYLWLLAEWDAQTCR